MYKERVIETRISANCVTRGQEEVDHLALVLVVGGEGCFPALHAAEHHLKNAFNYLVFFFIPGNTLVQVLQGRGAFIDLKQWLQFLP